MVMALNPALTTFLLCDLRLVTRSLCSTGSSCKTGQGRYFLRGLLGRLVSLES